MQLVIVICYIIFMDFNQNYELTPADNWVRAVISVRVQSVIY